MANIGYARCSTLAQDLTAQRQALAALGVPRDRIYLDKGLTGTSRARPGLDQALAAVREGDTLTVTKLDRLARSVQDALDILSHLSQRGGIVAFVYRVQRELQVQEALQRKFKEDAAAAGREATDADLLEEARKIQLDPMG